VKECTAVGVFTRLRKVLEHSSLFMEFSFKRSTQDINITSWNLSASPSVHACIFLSCKTAQWIDPRPGILKLNQSILVDSGRV
jgi:hypothetical protein